MRKHILTVILALSCLLSMNAQNRTTAPVFVVNGKTVENFDGTQLVGKTIKSYVVKDGKHTITTAEDSEELTVVGYSSSSPDNSIKVRTNGKDPIVVCDGKVITSEQLKKIDTSTVESISVVKDPDHELFKKYCKEGDSGVIIVTLKK